jgi:RNA 2',3'-cyclic 3'-phosphodiesterase
MKRLFIATGIITLSPELQQWKSGLRYALRHNDMVWVQDEVCHLTLRFLGATPDSKLPVIRKAMERAAAHYPPMTLNLDKAGVFGSRYAPKVLWFGFEDFTALKSLFADLEQQLVKEGFEHAYGNFVPHVTLARIKQVVDKRKFWKTIEANSLNCQQQIQINELTLYQSFLHKEGPEYKPLFKCRLS